MKITKLKNAIIYRATLPAVSLIGDHLAELPFSDIGETELSRASFVENPITGEIITPIASGYAVCLRIDEKIIPSQVVKKTAMERINSLEHRLGQRISKSDKKQITADVLVDLCKKAFVKTSLIYALYHEKENLLMVNTTSKRYSGILCSMLIKSVGSIKTQTIHVSDIKNGLTTRLKNYIAGNNSAFEGFQVGDEIQLSRLADKKETIRYSAEHENVSSEIEESLNTGFSVDKIQLISDGTSFLLTETFHFKRIDTKSTEASEGDDKAFQWRQAAGTDLFLMSRVVNKLCELLSYKEPEDKESNPTE